MVWLCHLLFVKTVLSAFESWCDILIAAFLFNSYMNLGGGLAKHPIDSLCELGTEAGCCHLCPCLWNWQRSQLPFMRSCHLSEKAPRSPGPVTSQNAAVEGGVTSRVRLSGGLWCELRPPQPISSAAIWHKYVQMPKTYCRLWLQLQPQGKANNYFLKAFLSVFSSKSRWWDSWG